VPRMEGKSLSRNRRHAVAISEKVRQKASLFPFLRNWRCRWNGAILVSASFSTPAWGMGEGNV